MLVNSWSTFKSIVDARSNMKLDYIEMSSVYWIKAYDDKFEIEYNMNIDDPASSDQTDFETNYAPTANTRHIPETLTANIYSKEAEAVCDEDIPADAEKAIDFKVPGTVGAEYRYIWGARCYPVDTKLGDYAKFQIVDVDNILGYGAGLVLKEYVKKRWMHSCVACVQREAAPGELLSGLYLRVVMCTTTEAGTRKLYIDFDLYTKD